MPLSEAQYEQCWLELQAMWNLWDPLDVKPAAGGPSDEYDAYVGHTLKLLEDGEAASEIADFLSFVAVDQMELDEEEFAELQPEEFSARLQAWALTKGFTPKGAA